MVTPSGVEMKVQTVMTEAPYCIDCRVTLLKENIAACFHQWWTQNSVMPCRYFERAITLLNKGTFILVSVDHFCLKFAFLTMKPIFNIICYI